MSTPYHPAPFVSSPLSAQMKGIREVPAWSDIPRVFVLSDGKGDRVCRAEIPGSMVTDRVMAILEDLNHELSKDGWGISLLD